jgi:hypothetical protein
VADAKPTIYPLVDTITPPPYAAGAMDDTVIFGANVSTGADIPLDDVIEY